VNKSEIRKKLLKIRKQKSSINSNISHQSILKVLKKKKKSKAKFLADITLIIMK
jgi:hypothetical protein